MNIIPIRISENKQIAKEPHDPVATTFKNLELQETHVEDFIRRHPELIFEEESLFLVGHQVHTTGKGFCDLVAIDENGNIVLVEVKRDLNDVKARREKFEYQAIRYAASLANISSPEDLVDKIYAGYIESHSNEYELAGLTARELGLRNINSFLRENQALSDFNQSQRIILIASEFDPQTESAVAWLISSGVDISCYVITPVWIDGKLYLQSERRLPQPELKDSFLDVLPGAKNGDLLSKSRKSRVNRTRLPKMDKLFEWGLVRKGDELYIHNRPENRGTAIDASTVEHDGNTYSYHEWCKLATGWSSVQTYAMIIKAENDKSLSELRKQKMDELELNTD